MEDLKTIVEQLLERLADDLEILCYIKEIIEEISE